MTLSEFIEKVGLREAALGVTGLAGLTILADREGWIA